jgi:hypothetical protein
MMECMSGSARQLNPAPSLEELARATLAGDKVSLEEMIRALQGDIFGLTLRMLRHREDSADAQKMDSPGKTRLNRRRQAPDGSPTQVVVFLTPPPGLCAPSLKGSVKPPNCKRHR